MLRPRGILLMQRTAGVSFDVLCSEGEKWDGGDGAG